MLMTKLLKYSYYDIKWQIKNQCEKLRAKEAAKDKTKLSFLEL